jgi:hypothetical protein
MIAVTFRLSSLVTCAGAINLLLITASAFGQSPVVISDKSPEPKIVDSRALNGSAPTVASGEKSGTVAAANTSEPESEATKPAASPTPSPTPAQCKRMIKADVVAIPQPIMLNRLGAAIPDGMIFALKSDTVGGQGNQLRPDKRPRPIVLRANVGDCLTINFANAIPPDNFKSPPNPPASPPSTTSEVSLHVQGMEWVTGPSDDGSFVGKNNSSLVNAVPTGMPLASQTYTLFAKEEGTFLLYTAGDTNTTGNQLTNGLFGALNVEPAGAEWYRSQVSQADLKVITKGTTPDGHPVIDYGAVYPVGAKYPDGTPIPPNTPVLSMLDQGGNIVHTDLTAIITGPKAGRFPGTTGVNNPEPNCGASNAVPPPGIDPLFCKNPASPDRKQPYREITVIYHGALGGVANQAFPILANAPQNASQAQKDLAAMTQAGQDAFAINYGTGGIGAEIYANRIGVGPMGNCADCKFEEFFLSSWSVGDPAMLVDMPANTNIQPPLPPTPAQPPLPPPPPLCSTSDLEGTSSTAPNPKCADSRQPTGTPLTGTVTFSNATATVTGVGTHFTTELTPGSLLALVGSPTIVRGTVKQINNDTQLVLQANAGANANGAYLMAQPYTLAGLLKATRVYYPDDPSNVYHSYINDHVKFRILHGGRDVSHVHHQHAHQWLQSPNSDESSYLDSQMISPGASYTLEMVYNGSGNRNKVVGDSIFHCHFYPHFAAGMWALWRTHDVFESGSELKNGIPVLKATRALPDGEISAGTPIPFVVPLPTLPMAPLPSPVFIDNGQVVYGTQASPDPTGQNVTVNPGFPFFIPGVAGARAPHPPLDFAPDGLGGFLDGGLPRHVVTGGTVSYESHDLIDWSKDLATLNAIKLPEDGTNVEKVAMKFFGKRCYAMFFPDGSPGSCPSSNSTPPQSTLNTPPTGFLVNGLPIGPQPGAPFADPAVDDNGKAVGNKRVYKAAAIQADVFFNTKEWHFPQQRILTLWKDVMPTLSYNGRNPSGGRKPEPLFFRGNSGDVIEYWHTNLVPNYYLVDDFQVRTPTDILGQHIHLVKFDVTSSDGAGNGFNYEDGTFAPAEVQEMIRAINHAGGLMVNGVATPLLAPDDPQFKTKHGPPKDIFDCVANPAAVKCQPCPDNLTPANRPVCNSWLGAQTTIQRWYIDPLVDGNDKDRTMRTVFTHDHFGPSTHQQAGLYAGLLIEPTKSQWLPNDGVGPNFGTRSDGGPTSWQAIIKTSDPGLSYREFALEFQDLQLAYQWSTICSPSGPPQPPRTSPSADPKVGWTDPAYAINPPPGMCRPGAPLESKPSLITTGVAAVPAGTQSVNYTNAPVAWRIGPANDMSSIYDNALKQASNAAPNGDPGTPLMRAYQNDNVQIRTLVGAHVFAHQFDLAGPVWFSEPSWQNSGYRSAQPMGLSEHFEMLFRVPSSSAPNIVRKCPDGMSQANCVDYLYSPSMDEFGISNGMWGLFRAYDPTKVAKTSGGTTTLAPLPNNTPGPGQNLTYATCPANAPTKSFKITAVTAQKALPGGKILFNSRGQTLFNDLGVLYVRSEDLDGTGKLNAGVPIEPLILRANAGDCINITLTNALDPASNVFSPQFSLPPPFNGLAQPSLKKMSGFVGLHPQLLGYDAARNTGMNIGWNRQNQPNQLAAPPGTANQPSTVNYQWYAGTITRPPGGGALVYTPVEFGALNLFPSDQLYQNFNGLFGQMIIEPPGASWMCGEAGSLKSCDPSLNPPPSRASATVTLPSAKTFREFSLMISDDIRIVGLDPPGAVNYRTEPQSLRYPTYPENLTGTATFTGGSKSVTGAGTTFTTELVGGANGDKLVLQSSPTTVRGQVQSITNNSQLTLAANASANASGPFAKLTSMTDFSCMTSNQLWNAPAMPVTPIGDPQTPIFTAAIGDQARFRMTHPFGTGTSQVFTVHGHVWQRNPYTNKSTQMGTNSLSQWIGSRDNHGSTDHFDIIVDKAGGKGGQAGDYLYTVFVPVQARNGAWGIFRVGNNNTPMQPNAACTRPPLVQPFVRPIAPKDDLERFIRQPVNKNPKP